MKKAAALDAGTLATYTVVGARGDDVQHPNAFFYDVRGVTPTLGDVKRAWPLLGLFHFSFKTKSKR